MSQSKRYQEIKKLVDPKKLYTPEEAVELVKKTSKTKFDATVELHLKLGIDVKKGEQQVRGTTPLPHNFGKAKRMAVFVSPEKEAEAKEAGADLVGGEELIAEIAKTNKTDFDIAIATPDMMVKLSKIAKILGPSGLMPNPKTDTVGPNVKKMIEEVKRGKIAFKNDATGIVHQAIGKVSMDVSALCANLVSFIEAVKKAKPASSKGTYMESATLASTMGPGIRLDVSKIGA